LIVPALQDARFREHVFQHALKVLFTLLHALPVRALIVFAGRAFRVSARIARRHRIMTGSLTSRIARRRAALELLAHRVGSRTHSVVWLDRRMILFFPGRIQRRSMQAAPS